MISDYDPCKNCAFRNRDAMYDCEYGVDNLIICSVLQKRMKLEKREVKNEAGLYNTGSQRD